MLHTSSALNNNLNQEHKLLKNSAIGLSSILSFSASSILGTRCSFLIPCLSFSSLLVASIRQHTHTYTHKHTLHSAASTYALPLALAYRFPRFGSTPISSFHPCAVARKPRDSRDSRGLRFTIDHFLRVTVRFHVAIVLIVQRVAELFRVVPVLPER